MAKDCEDQTCLKEEKSVDWLFAKHLPEKLPLQMKERSNQENKWYLPQEAGLPPECQIIINDVFVIHSRERMAFSLTSDAKEGVNSSVKCFFQCRVKDLSPERG